jgi:16S rRNA (cytosine1402-N4)-methyltransferase
MKMKEGKQMEHTPVMLDRCIALLTPSIEKSPNPVVVDATLGLGGHTEELLNRFPNLRVIALDRDPSAIAKSAERLAKFASRLTIIHAIYDQIPTVLQGQGLNDVDGILFDLGVSSMQLDNEERGFSYSKDAPLDMRMDTSSGITAAEIVNQYEKSELVRVIREYGEERFANRIAENIIRDRSRTPITSTSRLAELIKESIPAPARRVGEIQPSGPSRRCGSR